MSYRIERDQAVSIRHPVRDLAGALLTGQSGALGLTLYDPDNAISPITVSPAEIGSTGWYLLTVTPNVSGVWILKVDDPAAPTSLGQSTEYAIQTVDPTTGTAASSNLLTTLSRVKERLPALSGAENDTLINSLISEVSADLHFRMGRYIPEQAYTEYASGNGSDVLELRAGPVFSDDSSPIVESVVWSVDTDETRIETRTEIKNGYWMVLRDQGTLLQDGPGRLIRLGGVWESGVRNYRVQYTAGYDPIPEELVGAASSAVVARFLTREVEGLRSSSIADQSLEPSSPAAMDEALERVANRWRFDLGLR